jgi:hypothetical protein
MGKQSQAKKNSELHDVARSDSILQNKVHELIEYIESNFRAGDRIKKSFAAAALTGALKFLDEISGAEGIPDAKKIELLTTVYQAAAKKVEAINTSSAHAPLARWADRKNRFMSPCEFVKTNFPTYGKGLTLADIKEKRLYRALTNWKVRYGWPADFDLPSKSALLDKAVAKLGDTISLAGLDDMPPSVRKAKRQAYGARYRRIHRRR